MANYCSECGNALSKSSPSSPGAGRSKPKPRTKRQPSAYQKRYSAAFKKLESSYKKKNGGWKKDGFKRCGAAARKQAKR